jgi:ADP-heptose:LPS heptosyltransferase
MGDVLLAGPAVRAITAGSRRVTVLAGPHGRSAAQLLPGVDETLVWDCPWITLPAPPVQAAELGDIIAAVRARYVDRAVILTSFHQSALPTALVLRLAGVPWIAAVSEDYPGALLDRRLHDPGDVHEAERALAVARAAGYDLPAGDDGRLAVAFPRDIPVPRFDVVLHPGTSVPARAWPARHWAVLGDLLTAAGLTVAVTGSPAERDLVREVCDGSGAIDLAGQTSLPELAALLARAAVLVAGNTGAAHLAAATHTPVVSLFAPTVPAERWAPYRIPTVLLGDQDAACRGSRAIQCPVPGHPCLATVGPADVAAAVEGLRADGRSSPQLPVHAGGAP